MRVIGMDGQGNYIATVSHSELEKCADKYYGAMPKLAVGDTFDLGQGHDFRKQIVETCKAMQDAHKRFEVSSETMRQFAFMVAVIDKGIASVTGEQPTS